MSEGTRSEAEFPKMVYPHTNGDVKNIHAGSPETADFKGVIVQDEDQEKWVMDGNKLEDFGKEKAPLKEGDAGWKK